MNRSTFAAALALLWITAAVSQAWDDCGHLLVNEIAATKLRPEVARKIESLMPLLDAQSNDNRPYNLVTAGTWLDDLRKTNRDWSRWHYVDVPCAGDAFVEPAPPHALWALDQATAVLRSGNATPQARAEAVAQIMHIIADIHQPVHTASRNGDRGGNEVAIEPLTDSGRNPANLHAFWDAAYRYDVKGDRIVELWFKPARAFRPSGPNVPGVIAQTARDFLAQAPENASRPPLAGKPWHVWARETHAIACQSGWPEIGQGPVALTPLFVHQAHEIARQQIVKAGLRLAAVLNGELSTP